MKEIDSVIEAIEAGHTQQYDAALTQQHSEEFERLARKQAEGDGKTVMLIESSIKVQDALRQNLKELGYRTLIIGDAQRAIRRFEDLDPAEDRPADCVIFGCTGLGRLGIEAFNYFSRGKNTAAVPAILLMPTELKKFLADVNIDSHHMVLDLPLKFKRMRAALKQLLSTVDQQP